MKNFLVIMNKNLFLATMAIVAFVACSDNIADTPSVVVSPVSPDVQEVPIMFGPSSQGSTRAVFEGVDAAKLLGYQFVVSGKKGTLTASEGTIVFDNYAVKYTENSAFTTESNTRNWEYVGVDRIKHAIDHGITRQTIKYWDYNLPQYDFIAWSTGNVTPVYEGTPADGQVLVSAITPNSATGTTGVAYTFQGKAKDLEGCYISDLVTVKKAEYAKFQNENPVTLRFRSLGSKVRIGIYETVPGYSVKDVKFYDKANSALADETDATNGAANKAKNAVPKLFTTSSNDIFTQGTYTIYFPTVDDTSNSDNNQAHVKFAGTGTQSTLVEFANLNLTMAEEGEKTAGAVFLGRSSKTASMAGEAEGNYYTQYMPNETGANLNLRVDFTLESIDGSGETITVKGATAQVPSIYTQWKSGFAYTYLFKISDKTNGHTGVYDPTNPDDTEINSDPAGLYPITFDAVVVNEEEDATQETITTVSTPSITTYQKGSNVVNNDEYLASTGNIFVTVNDGTSATTPDLANGSLQTLTGKAALYTISSGVTEAEVVDALSIQADDAATGTVKGRNGMVLTEASFTLGNKVEYGADGNTISVGTDQALWFTPAAATTYAFVYTKQASSSTANSYEPVTVTPGASVAGLWRYNYAAASGDVQKGVAYYDNDGAVTVFVGQSVSNLYLRENTGTADVPSYVYTIASGYAKTGTDYFYTLDHGMSYLQAVNIAYADFESATLYTLEGTTYTAKTETTPVDGKAYYQKQPDDSYRYCVILPQQADGLDVLDTTQIVECATNEPALAYQTYFDRYVKNNGVYYVKVIKVQ